MAGNVYINQAQIKKLVNVIIKDRVDKAIETSVKPTVYNTVMKYSVNANDKDGKSRTLKLGRSENISVVYNKTTGILTAKNITPPHESVFGKDKCPIKNKDDDTLLSFWISNGCIPVLWGAPYSGNPSPKLQDRIERYTQGQELEFKNGFKVAYHFKAIPFIQQAKEELTQNKCAVIKDALIKGLKANGISASIK